MTSFKIFEPIQDVFITINPYLRIWYSYIKYKLQNQEYPIDNKHKINQLQGMV